MQGKQEGSIEETVPEVTHEEVVEIEDTGDRDRSTSDACSITPQFTPPVTVSPQNPDTPPDKTKCSLISPDWNDPFAFRRSYSLPVNAPPMQYIYPRDVSYFVVQCYLWPSCLTMIECCICELISLMFALLFKYSLKRCLLHHGCQNHLLRLVF